MRKVLIIHLCAAVGLCTSAVSWAQFVPSPPTQPRVHLWEPPKTEIPLREQFGSMVRILICGTDVTPQQVVDGGIAPDQIDLQGGGPMAMVGGWTVVPGCFAAGEQSCL